MIKTFIIFFIILGIGYYGFNYYKDKNGIGFRKVDAVYTVQLGQTATNNSKLTMKKDGTYELDFCGITKGNYEIIDSVYNFKFISFTNASDQEYCKSDLRQIYTNLRGKFIVTKSEDGSLFLTNDNNYQFYLYKY